MRHRKQWLTPETGWIVSILILALVLRLIHLNGSFWLDEAAQALESIRPLSEQFHIANDFQPPLFHIVVHFWSVLGKSEWLLRLTSLIPGLITVWLTIRIGKKLWNQRVGLMAGLLLATSQFHLFYSQELRPYSIAAMWAMLSLFFYYRLLDKKRFAWIGFLLSGIAGLYSMYLFPLFLMALLCVTAIYHRLYIKQVFGVMAVMAAAFLPWLPSFMEQLGIGTTLATTLPAWSGIVSPPLSKMLPLTAVKFLIGRITVDQSVTGLLPIIIVGITCIYLLSGSLRHPKSRETALWVIIPVLTAFIISIKIPVLDPKRLLFCLPGVYLLLAEGVGRKLRSLVPLIILLAVNAFSIFRYAIDANEQREPWREAVAAIESVSETRDTVIFAFDAPFAPWVWYQTKTLPTVAIAAPDAEMRELITVTKTTYAPGKIILFDYLADVTDPGKRIITTLTQAGFAESQIFFQYPGIGKIRIFEPVRPVALR